MTEQPSIFENRGARPLADRMRPRHFSGFVGQSHVLGEDGILGRLIAAKRLVSLILWGPPGCGKTTLARLLAARAGLTLAGLSAVHAGVKDVRDVVREAERRIGTTGSPTCLFIDEIHRFNKAQQDGLLPHVESGLITLIGATTENPSFEVISPLLSRTRVVVLGPLSPDEIIAILKNAIADETRGLGGMNLFVDEDAIRYLSENTDGDARGALNALEAAARTKEPDGEGRVVVLRDDVAATLAERTYIFDKDSDGHYNLISALHRSIRGSDPDAALYYLTRMLEAGEDPLYLARRLIRAATEDVGLADPHALSVCIAAKDAYHFLGSPEGELALAEAALYLALAPKSNSVYTALGRARDAVRETGSLAAPRHILNAPTGLMKNLGYGRDYQYPHDFEEGFVTEEYLPEKLRGKRFFRAVRGLEKELEERLEKLRAAAREAKSGEPGKK